MDLATLDVADKQLRSQARAGAAGADRSGRCCTWHSGACTGHPSLSLAGTSGAPARTTACAFTRNELALGAHYAEDWRVAPVFFIYVLLAVAAWVKIGPIAGVVAIVGLL